MAKKDNNERGERTAPPSSISMRKEQIIKELEYAQKIHQERVNDFNIEIDANLLREYPLKVKLRPE